MGKNFRRSLYAMVLISLSIMAAKKLFREDNFVLEGWITQQTFIDLVSFYEKKGRDSRKIVVESEGGHALPAIAIGMYVREKGLDIEVEGYCLSACANYIFTAGKTKYVKKYSQIIYHGGALQEDLEDQVINIEKDKITRDDKEAHLSYSDDQKYNARLLRYLGLEKSDVDSPIKFIRTFQKLEREFFEEVGVDQKITIYGQMGKYKKRYSSKKYIGFYYQLDDLRKMGVSNIVVKNDKWDLFHRSFKKDLFYQVKLSDMKADNRNG